MSGYPGGHNDRYDDGYGHQGDGHPNADSYYQDDQYYDSGYDARGAQGAQGGEGFYDESYVQAFNKTSLLLPFPALFGQSLTSPQWIL